jgi:hypothetical protein
MWLVLQMSVMIAVLCANIYYQLTPNGVLAGLLDLLSRCRGSATLQRIIKGQLLYRRPATL